MGIVDPRDPLAPAPTGEEITPEPTTAEPVVPVAGVAGVEGQPTQPDGWDTLPDWARAEITAQRRRARTLGEQIASHGWIIDDRGVVRPPDRPIGPIAPTTTPSTSTGGLAAERRQYFTRRMKEAELADDPDDARVGVLEEMGTEMARAATIAAMRGVAPMTVPATVGEFKQRARADPQRGKLFTAAEADFDALMVQAQEEAAKVGFPFIPDETTLGMFRDMAIGRAAPRALTSAAVTRQAQGDQAARVAASTSVAGGTTTRPAGGVVPLTGEEGGILGSMARGAGLDEAALAKRYGERKGRGE